MRIVRRGHAAARNLPFPTPSRHGLRRRRLATTAIAQVIRTAAARTSRRSVRSRLTTTIAAIRHSAPTIRRPRARTQSREHIPHRAAAIQLRPDPTPHRRIPPPAAVIAAVAGAAALTTGAEGGGITAGGGAGSALYSGSCGGGAAFSWGGGWRRRTQGW